MDRKRIFVTGATGRIGRPLIKKLLEQDYAVCAYGLGEQYVRRTSDFQKLSESYPFSFEVGSILDSGSLMHAMRGASAVIHLAALVDPKRTETERLRCIDINVEGTRLALCAALANDVNRFVLASSAAVYGSPAEVPVTETAPVRPDSLYGLTKVMAEETTRAFEIEYPKLECTILRIFSAYGNGGNADLVVEAFAQQAVAGNPISVFGKGSDIRCFTHVDDVVAAFLAAVSSAKAGGRTYNIGNPSAIYSIAELAAKVAEKLGPDGKGHVEFVELPPGRRDRAVLASHADIARAQAELGFSPLIDLDEGLTRIAAAISSSDIKQ